LLGEIALARGDAESAIEYLETARSMLSPRGLLRERGRLNYHVPIWYSLATAYLALGDGERAESWFRKIVDSEYEHLYWPICYVRSMYSLASLHRDRGDPEEARRLYRKFLEYWREGDLDRDHVEEAIRLHQELRLSLEPREAFVVTK
jgi:tetratricopeptide (TPR) repeat protein